MAKTKKNIAKGKNKKKRQARLEAQKSQAPETVVADEQALAAEKERMEKQKSKEIAEKRKKRERKENPTFWDKTVAYFRSTWVELKKTQWLDAAQLNKATGSVFGIVTVFTALTWLVDSGLGALTAFILGL